VVNPNIPDPLEPVLLKALTKEPSDRFASMADFLAAWKKALAQCRQAQPAGQAVTVLPEATGSAPEKAAKPVTMPPQTKQQGMSPWVWVAGGAGLLILLCGVLAGGAMTIRMLRNRPRVTTTQYVLAAAPRPSETSAAPEAAMGESDLTAEAVKNMPPTWTLAPLPTQTAPSTKTPAPTDAPQPTGLPTQIADGKGMPMVLVPAGAFQMGSNLAEMMQYCPQWNHGGECVESRYMGEAGMHTVVLDAFYIDLYEVTNEAYARCVQAGECKPPVDISVGKEENYYTNPGFSQYPVVHVTWDMARNYCGWRGGRLPTEAEWEKAARGTDQRIFPWGNDFSGLKANLCDAGCPGQRVNQDITDGYLNTSPVGAYPEGKSFYGAYDMAGNVWEWVLDWYDPGYYASQMQGATNPTGAKVGKDRVLRGGSWVSNIFNLRTALRYAFNPEQQAEFIGFRCVMEP
jgi:formylglycine-generating enzyme required for sulfatase activity